MANTIKIYTNQATAPFVMSVEGTTTLADVKSYLSENGVDDLDNSKFVVRAGKLELGFAESVVPAGDQTIMVSPSKTKAGIKAEDFLDESGKASGTRLMRAMEAFSNEVEEKVNELKAEIEKLKADYVAEEVTLDDSNEDYFEEDYFEEEEFEDDSYEETEEDKAVREEMKQLF